MGDDDELKWAVREIDYNFRSGVHALLKKHTWEKVKNEFASLRSKRTAGRPALSKELLTNLWITVQVESCNHRGKIAPALRAVFGDDDLPRREKASRLGQFLDALEPLPMESKRKPRYQTLSLKRASDLFYEADRMLKKDPQRRARALRSVELGKRSIGWKVTIKKKGGDTAAS